MKKSTLKSEFYIDGRFNIEIIETKYSYEYWLNEATYGTTELVYGINKEEITKKEFLEMIKKTLETDKILYLDSRDTEEELWNEYFEKERKEKE